MPGSVSLNPHPQSVRYLALLTRSRVLEENDQARISAALENGRDPAMASLHANAEYLALIQQVENM